MAFVALASGYALATPAWNNPDEPAHYNYVRHVVANAALPELRPGDWDAERLEALKAARFPPGESIEAIRYESHQPPLYYLLAAPVLGVGQLSGQAGSVLALRGLSILFGLLLVLTTYRLAAATLSPAGSPASGSAAGRERQPSAWLAWPAIPLLAAALAAFVPMWTAMSAAINNDALASLLSATLMLVLLQALARGMSDRGAASIGLLCGALLLTKLTAYGLVPIALAVVALAPVRAGGERRWRRAARALALAAGVMALVAGWWFVRQGLVYGWDDLLASRRHEAVVAGQPRWADLGVEPGSYFLSTLFHSFWAQFGWMGILVDDRLYRLFGLFSALALAGAALWLRQSGRARLVELSGQGKGAADSRQTYAPADGGRMALLLAACLVVATEVLYYNLVFVQPQGRYLFPALAPLAVIAAVGWDSVVAESRPGRGLAAAWLVAALLESGGLILGLDLSPRVSYGAAITAGMVVGVVTPPGPTWPWLRQGLLAGAGLALGLLNLACLATAVMPTFRPA